MIGVTLTRGTTGPKGTFGMLSLNGEPLTVTCEEPWLDNAKMVSCIPDGKYQVEKYSSAKFPYVWEIKGVPNRTAILIHAGNTIDDTHGCVLVGRCFNKYSISESQAALTFLRTRLPDSFMLTVRGLK